MGTNTDMMLRTSNQYKSGAVSNLSIKSGLSGEEKEKQNA
jgi:hypothetical protein